MLTVSGSSHDLKKLGPNSSYDHFSNSCVLQDLKISLLRFFTDYPVFFNKVSVENKNLVNNLVNVTNHLNVECNPIQNTDCYCSCGGQREKRGYC